MSISAQVPLVNRLISSSVIVASHAGKIIRDVMAKGELGIVEKENAHDLQTEADRSAQQCIVGTLSSHFPKLKIIGEEDENDVSDPVVDAKSVPLLSLTCPQQFSTLKEEDVVVWVDPLDGTAEYTQGLLDHVTVLIGIAAGGKAVGGIIHQPYYNYQNPGAELGRTIWGIVGGGVGGMKIGATPSTGCIVTTTRSHSNAIVNDAVAAINPSEVMRVGGAGHKVMLLLEGKAHVYMFASPGCKKWDTCAPQAILEAAGGALTDIYGNPIPYDEDVQHRNSTGVVASAPGLCHHDYIGKIPDHVKESLKP